MRTEYFMEQNFRNELNQAIDFSSVLTQISAFSSFSCAKEKILNALPVFDKLEIQEQLNYAKEAIQFEQAGGLLSLSGANDISLPVSKASKQMTLTSKELISIYHFLTAVKQAKQSLDGSDYPELTNLAQSMDGCTRLMDSIISKIDLTGSVKEDATPALKSMHKALVDTRLALQSKSRQFLKKNSSKLMENMTTTVSGRVVVLVRAQDKNAFGGMIHGQSSSGLAYYVEPSSFVADNNEISSLMIRIEEEKKRICKELSMQVKKNALSLTSALETLTVIDVAFTKAKWAVRYDGCIPSLQSRDHSMYLEHAKHPLIDEKKVVCNTYELNDKQACLMISGPNMGGKTVTLKTIGLFVALAHAAFPVLCHKAILPFYQSMYFDIGDHQSIENNLSTFSSHISRLSHICQKSDENSFILLDEIGNGTDPLEGASLAVAILEYLISKRSTIITSTHYSQVKTYGKANDSVLVSSVEFNPETLKPTYKYIPGVSGASYAFHIAREYNLEESILERADFLKNENEKQTEKELEKLEKLQNDVLKQKERFNQLIEDAHRVQKEAYEKEKEIEKRKAQLDASYQEQLNEMLEKKKAEAKEILTVLRKEKTGKQHKQIEKMHELDLLNEHVEEVEDDKKEFKVGDYVKITGLNSHGEIVDIRRNEATVLTNGMKMKVKISKLEPMHKPQIKKATYKAHVESVSSRFPLELNLIGMRVEEGIAALDKYLDQAVVKHIKQVRIIHGVGTGALRTAVWKDLKKQPNVSKFNSAGPSEGGLGATIVILK